MEIKYQTLLNEYPTWQKSGFDFVFVLEPISIDEIIALEDIYNAGHPFPTSLREVLFLAGKYCHVLDYGLFETQAVMQIKTRNWLIRSNYVIDRPFFVVDVYNASDQFLFVYLDEDQSDPIVYEAFLAHKVGVEFIECLGQTLSEFVNLRMKRLLKGQNPF